MLTLDQNEENRFDLTVRAATFGILRLSKNSNFRDIVNGKVAEQFDGDDNALLSSINSVATSNGIIMSDSFTTSINTYYNGTDSLINYVDEAIGGLLYYGSTEYVQVYIPFIDQVNLSSNPIICINLNDDDTLKGYQLNNGVLDSFLVTETMAQETLIWVISVNERMYGHTLPLYGNIPSNEIEMDEDTLFTNEDYYKTNTNPNMKFLINAIRISDEKEAWGNGRSDISWVGGVYDYSSFNRRFHEDIRKVKGNEINSWIPLGTERTSYFSDEFDYRYEPSASNGAFLLYERDVRPQFNRVFTPVYYTPLSGTNTRGVNYVSKESAYGEVYLPSSYFYYTESFHGKYVYLNGAQITVVWKYVP